ncbi:pyrroloquinoline quinone biosynthesis protein PqqF [Erwinia persicina]|uniref:pyrroloquinoline quinone biosynthesis protein PqqF n=1 Tax=Erwinia persicina TaxID=55211 RepID=UPI00210DD4D3|nr:pyrroloquinoline quinone biosynthesis protein PqqF [Erwinia persicina]MCQ4094224.1 pyrroloquinoline quinone biosynthesis protein PqqF [Erwinia persicina]MCQ4101013.1 pyrroloquinoline quinone biosynthesis protein PqqF [Erwinia persicina]
MQHLPRRLSNGLRVELIHDPQATRAAALLQVEVGSHHEPDAWPGLAHLLEHLLFAGSQAFQDDQRLMAWLPARGGRLNATTLGSSTAYFFECAPEQLADALPRLTDMLVAPLLSASAIRQEVATIDAECRLLADHQDTLCDAALSTAFVSHLWHRFQTGNAAGFGDDHTALRAALQQFHQRYYHADTVTLWVQGPQPIAALWSLAQQAAEVFPAGVALPPALPALTLAAERDIALQLTGAPRLRLSFLLNQRIDGGLTVLRQLLLDEAAGSLMATLREQALCDAARLLLPYRSAQQAVITLELVLVDAGDADRVEACVHRWLAQLARLTPAQRAHYAQLASRRFAQLPVMDQLRERAFGFAPAGDDEGAILFPLLSAAPLSRLWIADSTPLDQLEVQGWTLACQPGVRAPVQPDSSGEAFVFFPHTLPPAIPTLPVRQATLAHHRRDESPAVLLLSPECNLPAPWGQIVQARLRALAAGCAHCGGELAIGCPQGRWLVQLQGEAGLMVSTLASLNALLAAIPPGVIARGEREFLRQRQALHDDIAVRALLGALPEKLQPLHPPADAQTPLNLPWRAVLEGGDHALHRQLACLLSAFPAAINPAKRALPEALTPQPEYRVATRSPEAALLRFCPLVEESTACLAAWQLLAMIYQPLFFQRLRVEQNIGYVVSCRFYQVAGRSGILFALQSPHLTTAELAAYIDHFLAQMNTELATLSPQALWETCQILLKEQQQVPGGALEASRDRWLQAQQMISQPGITDLQALTPDSVLAFHQRLLADGQRAFNLVNHSLF